MNAGRVGTVGMVGRFAAAIDSVVSIVTVHGAAATGIKSTGTMII